jgi:AcrR family transcriptional regulator
VSLVEQPTAPDGGTPQQAREPSARQKIVTAAFSVLAERGSHDASIKEIAKAAGIAPGLVHYYFASKGELLLEIVREACRSYQEQMNALELPEDPIARTGALLAWSKKRGLELPDWYRLMVDLDALALRDEKLAVEVAQLKRDVRDHTAKLVAATEQKLGVSLGVSHDGISAVLMTSVDGLILQKLIDPSFDLEGGFDALEKLLLGLMHAVAPAR